MADSIKAKTIEEFTESLKLFWRIYAQKRRSFILVPYQAMLLYDLKETSKSFESKQRDTAKLQMKRF